MSLERLLLRRRKRRGYCRDGRSGLALLCIVALHLATPLFTQYWCHKVQARSCLMRCVLCQVGDGALSLAEVHASVKVPAVGSQWYKKAAAFAGLGGMIAVGYMDPGNW